MRRGIAERNRSIIRAVAHRLAGNFAIFNLNDLRSRCTEIQKGALELPEAPLFDMAQALFDGFSAIRPQLEALLSSEQTEKEPRRS
jgi:HPt (histidine-containing phosphotransfer) domain-containing protein